MCSISVLRNWNRNFGSSCTRVIGRRAVAQASLDLARGDTSAFDHGTAGISHHAPNAYDAEVP
jgi:hypothetical protein